MLQNFLIVSTFLCLLGSGVSFSSLFSFSYAESSGDDSNSSCDAEQPATSPGVTSLELTHKGDEKVNSELGSQLRVLLLIVFLLM